MWPVVRGRLPAPPAQVVEIGCGPLGGFVPMLRSSGYEALGVDPEAPDDVDYRRVEFEEVELACKVDAVVASTSLHHVADPAEVIDRIASSLVGGGTLIGVPFHMPAPLFGIDLSFMTQQVMENFKAMQDGKPPTELDPDEMNEHLGRMAQQTIPPVHLGCHVHLMRRLVDPSGHTGRMTQGTDRRERASVLSPEG
jgi:SAM-dependent methyltransferase